MSLLHRLRSATGELHRQLDSSPWPGRATRSRHGYSRYLERFHRGLAGSWPEVDWSEAAALGLPDLEMRRQRYRSLEADLSALGRRTVLVPESGGARDFAAPGATVGCLYVLEGSVHGGRHLLAALEANTGPVPESESAFFRGFGERTISSWREFVSWLDFLNPSAGFTSAAEAAAMRAFGHFINAFGAHGQVSRTPPISKNEQI